MALARFQVGLAMVAVLASCEDSSSCDVEAQKARLLAFASNLYLWADDAPHPAPDGFTTVEEYFRALLFTGNPTVPRDRYSFINRAGELQRTLGEGQLLGCGFYVNGKTLGTGPFLKPSSPLQLPLRVSLVEPLGPAAKAGVKRGDTIVSINGFTSTALVAANDLTALPLTEGNTVTVVIDNGAGPVMHELIATYYPQTPIPIVKLLTISNGTKVGYLMLSGFTSPAEEMLVDALTEIRHGGATEIVVDLRNNAGGYLQTATLLASLIAGKAHPGETFAATRHNRMHRSDDEIFHLSTTTLDSFSRVMVIMSDRTCSASEAFVNGLKPITEVVTIGATSCGKPVGFDPPVSMCGSEFVLVSFEVVNGAGAGQYYDGLAPTCPVSDDFTGTPGQPDEKLTAAALAYLDGGGTCPMGAAPSP